MTILIVGAGLSGCVLAQKYAELGKEVVVLEKRDHIGGNCYDYIDENGILVGKYGPHFFHTNSEEVWQYIQRFSVWKPWKHKVYGRYKEKYFPVPINIRTVNIICNTQIQTEEEMREYIASRKIHKDTIQNSEEYALSHFGKELYDIVIKGYTKKQWEREPRELDSSVVARIPIRYSKEEGYFTDKYQVLPEKGYTYFCSQLLNDPKIQVKLNTEYKKEANQHYEKIFYTGPIDMYFEEYNLEHLEYRSLRFSKETIDKEYFQENSQINYTDESVPYTRIVEYKHLLDQKSEKTTIVKEYPSATGEPYYPIPNEKNQLLYEQYRQLAIEEEAKNVYFIGRLANYKYFNMDQAIENALLFFKKIEN
jgi:UDP-galactopyranose mutase